MRCDDADVDDCRVDTEVVDARRTLDDDGNDANL